LLMKLPAGSVQTRNSLITTCKHTVQVAPVQTEEIIPFNDGEDAKQWLCPGCAHGCSNFFKLIEHRSGAEETVALNMQQITLTPSAASRLSFNKNPHSALPRII